MAYSFTDPRFGDDEFFRCPMEKAVERLKASVLEKIKDYTGETPTFEELESAMDEINEAEDARSMAMIHSDLAEFLCEMLAIGPGNQNEGCGYICATCASLPETKYGGQYKWRIV